MPGEQDPSRFEAFKQSIAERFAGIKQSFNNAKAVGEIGAVGVGATLGLITPAMAAEQTSTEPVNANAANNPTATASDQTQECVDAALNGLHINNKFTTVASPGDKVKQQLNTNAILDPVSPDCLPLISRGTPQIFFKMQRPNNPKQWRRTKTQPMAYDYKPIDGNVGGKGNAFVWADYGSGVMRDPNFLYRCTPGKGITHVRAVYNLKVYSAIDGSLLGHKIDSAPTRIMAMNSRFVNFKNGGVPRAC